MSAITLNAGPNFKNESVFCRETGYGSRRKVVFQFVDCVLPLVDDAGVGGVIANKLFDLPAEAVQIEASRINLTIARASGTTTSLSDTFDGDIGLGTAAGAGATPLSGTECDIITNTDTPQAVGGVSTVKASIAAKATVSDFTAGASGYLNILVDDADQDGSTTPATVKLNGTITVHYTVLGK